MVWDCAAGKPAALEAEMAREAMVREATGREAAEGWEEKVAPEA